MLDIDSIELFSLFAKHSYSIRFNIQREVFSNKPLFYIMQAAQEYTLFLLY